MSNFSLDLITFDNYQEYNIELIRKDIINGLIMMDQFKVQGKGYGICPVSVEIHGIKQILVFRNLDLLENYNQNNFFGMTVSEEYIKFEEGKRTIQQFKMDSIGKIVKLFESMSYNFICYVIGSNNLISIDINVFKYMFNI